MIYSELKPLKNQQILVTGGAGFIGSNLCETLLENNIKVVCLDNFSTGKKENISAFLNHTHFKLIEGDIRNLEDCKKACVNTNYILHQAALGSVPRSIEDPITTNDVNISGFLNMLVAARDAKIKRFVYAASSSTYGDHEALPKEEDTIGKPLSPYAITKYVNELYADIFHKTYQLDTIGLRYFNVFGKKQDPNGAYAAVIPKFIHQLINLESPVINGDGSYSRDFTYIDNIIQINIKALTTKNENSLNTIYNAAFGEQTTLLELFDLLKMNLSGFDNNIKNVELKFRDLRAGDIPHSLASIDKAKKLLNYEPKYNIASGLNEAISWYWKHLK
ncbi:SDR family oxidoreductase [Siansivirga zeaxanthinifaciens]|uniref:Vi polysaccharide biosynthesis protein VipB/TviC n=1 Tax=Siansivirga zeaxanthinifaciens CC-SAMT-1 TaxID=1454006 RepID=A0A0C5WGK9_9FLAO|nr:SDR family oxidoreductase [Siansivirga zeaxanthinifaciens]AJR04284.1 Vi polysaccharide biosynthesis protein VipB/TviC [Siansivirga zeaxanthinifaciens CC-SAMT-1]